MTADEGFMLRLWINDERTVLVRQYDDLTMEVALRDDAGDIWGPPIVVELDTERLAE